ncbi:Phosphoribosylamine--glycine ligase [bioreactor metagenome]|uniref:phosphoribosylamine--glycine ligase n=1 Tax=bioreactor metagenome TaxID=1076179 RepID=A0A645EH39_9ZZZZ
MNREGRTFKGCLYFGLMLTKDGPKVIEYNARFGDPETQVILPRLKTDLFDIMLAVSEGRLADIDIEWKDNAVVCIVMASGGYPKSYQKGYEISGIEQAKKLPETKVYHAGTNLAQGKLVTNGGRVLGVTRQGKDLDEAIKNAYEAVKLISFKDVFYRQDIGVKK